MGRAKNILSRLGTVSEALEIHVGGDRYDGGVVYVVKKDGKEIGKDVVDGDNDIEMFGQKFDGYVDLEKFLKSKHGVSNIKRVEMKEAYSPKDIQSVLVALNSTSSFGDKYPFGNKELTAKVKDMESQGLISYDDKYNKWSKGKK
jgi:hypothetical protein